MLIPGTSGHYVHSVFKDWLFTLPFRMQSVMMASLRGCDIVAKDDPSKFVTRGLRMTCFHNADPSNTYMVGDGTVEKMHVDQFLWDLDRYPMHFVMHTAHAAEIVGYKHPDQILSDFWLGFYKKICKGLHLNYETESQLNVRLGRSPEEKAFAVEQQGTPKKVKDPAKPHLWDDGTGTSHNTGDRPSRGGS